MSQRHWILIIVFILLIIVSYPIHFGIRLDQSLSSNSSDWGSLGDYVGGLINPLLSFVSILLIIKTINLQRSANDGLRDQSISAEKNERRRSFEEKFFRLVEAQSSQFEKTQIDIHCNNSHHLLPGTLAVDRMEAVIASIRSNASDRSSARKAIERYVSSCDETDQLFSCVRRFYVITRIIKVELGDDRGFSSDVRESYLTTLVNFTEFSLLRLIFLTCTFTDYPVSKEILDNVELRAVLSRLNFNYEIEVPSDN